MKLHEFQAKRLLTRFGVSSPPGRVALTPDEARNIAVELDVKAYAVKAQILAGGRGRAGGVRLVQTPTEVETAAAALIGQRLVTEQNGPKGHLVKRVLVEAAMPIRRTLHVSLFVDRSAGEIVVLASLGGGDDIEERFRRGDLKLERLSLGAGRTSALDGAKDLAGRLGLDASLADRFADLVERLRQAFIDVDASLIEINPLVVTDEGALMAADAKIVVDDNALFRQPEMASYQDEEDLDETEVNAQRRQLNYMELDGNIGLACNGAGLGLATLDMVKAAGGNPANFMDIRTTAKSLDVAYGFGLLLKNPQVKSILINVHGGGMQPCDTIAEGLGIAMRRTGRSCPTIVRLAGKNADFARNRFANFGCKVIECPDMWSAAQRAVAAAK
ncbi:Succinyl-CoA ligase [ADP-forming] subunit beta [Hartmannibacter diazotrophicus]|uniref:Succinyl-CoA ligase [ADP-forming] subunit beta n=1 Tax=Hartmannibacter diazotrophicus TaxID=1482074 RepID=A0A2C9DBL6_9HYPH|nr:ADP-forming succinate--CoA ligase subunit beta [Hartmannibacter diazotrophicus]SON57697.1 Succinyl-CoA ligase [ADP-forming] subunit beta [Hartmannibacter diazotrophicus]